MSDRILYWENTTDFSSEKPVLCLPSDIFMCLLTRVEREILGLASRIFCNGFLHYKRPDIASQLLADFTAAYPDGIVQLDIRRLRYISTVGLGLLPHRKTSTLHRIRLWSHWLQKLALGSYGASESCLPIVLTLIWWVVAGVRSLGEFALWISSMELSFLVWDDLFSGALNDLRRSMCGSMLDLRLSISFTESSSVKVIGIGTSMPFSTQNSSYLQGMNIIPWGRQLLILYNL